MTHRSPNQWAFSLLLAPAFAVGCADDTGPLSVELPPSARPLVASMGNHLVVSETLEVDDGGDGSIDSRTLITRWFDAHGDVTSMVTEQDELADGSLEARSTTQYELNPHGTVVGYTIDHDRWADGSVDNRTVVTTVEFDGRGNPVRQRHTWDQGADGVVDSQTEWTNEFDSRGNLIRQFEDGSWSREFAYDAHGNVVHWSGDAGPNITSEFDSHDALVHQVTDWGFFGITEMSTVAYDRQMNPTRQVIESTNTAGLVERITRVLTYDNRRNLLSVVEDRDSQGDGSVDRRETRTYQYVGDGPMKQAVAGPVTAPPDLHGLDLPRIDERRGVLEQSAR